MKKRAIAIMAIVPFSVRLNDRTIKKMFLQQIKDYLFLCLRRGFAGIWFYPRLPLGKFFNFLSISSVVGRSIFGYIVNVLDE